MGERRPDPPLVDLRAECGTCRLPVVVPSGDADGVVSQWGARLPNCPRCGQQLQAWSWQASRNVDYQQPGD